MSTTSKTITWIVVAVVVIGGIWWYVSANQSQNPNTGVSAAANQTGENASGTMTDTSSTQMSQGNSDQNIDQNMAQIDGQMSAYSSDSANVDQSMNDQQVQQGQ